MYESKFLKKEKKSNNKLVKFLNKILFLVLIVLTAFILCKKDPKIKKFVKEEMFEKNFSFAKINKWYKDKFGSVIPIDDILPTEDDISVFSEKLKYKEADTYKDGGKLIVSNNYLIPVLKSGIVVFIGEKENYGKTVIVQQVDGVDAWYGNISTESVKIYDYIEEGTLLGECNENFLYVAFQKDGKFLNYKNYI